MNINIQRVDYHNPRQAADLVAMLNAYAQDEMGGGSPLKAQVQETLAAEMAKFPGAFSFVCYVDDQPVGLANCFMAFSTFKAKPIVNIHDIAVFSTHRGLGLSQKLLQAVEDEARARGCCKVTLEVLSGNDIAKKAYEKFGFSGYELDPKVGHALFWEKSLG
ncbi:GNAT family N-acetyltransferase [Reinekea sp. G2M2-21]|uniref:GNAT family N-acetyltransferase n=1 Tax=Reinekea sp. G2M2-21 TaxID=2788942 RepID=UPI00351C34FD